MSERTIIRGTNLFDGNGPVRKDMTVVVQGERISHVGPDGSGPNDGHVIDLKGKMLMPGMTVGHWHGEFVSIGPPVFSAGRAGTFLGTEQPPAILAFQAAAAMRNALLSGVTRVVSGSCAHNLDIQVKMAVDKGLIDGPRLTPCSRHIVTTSDYEDRGKWWQAHGEMPTGIRRIGANVFVDGVEQVLKAVRQEILFGAEIIKLLPSNGHGFEWTNTYRGMRRDEMRAAVDAAHERDKRVRAHVTGKDTIMECLDLGVDIIDHGDYLDEEVIERMVKQGTFFIPSMAFSKMLAGLAGVASDSVVKPIDRSWANMEVMLPKANAAGVKIVPGDDYGGLGMEHEPGIYASELEIYTKEIGIPASDVLRWTTANGAALALESDNSGTIEMGKLADLIVVDGDPIADISILRDPGRYLVGVMVGGSWFKDALDGPDNSAAVNGKPGKFIVRDHHAGRSLAAE